MRLAGCHDCIPDGGRILWMAEDLEAKLAGVARPGHENGNAFDSPPKRPIVKRNSPSSLSVGRPGGVHRIARQDLARLRTLNGDVVDLIARGLEQNLRVRLRCLLLDPEHTRVIAADPAEVVIAETEQRAVIDHAAVLVADRRIVDLADGELPDVAREDALAETLRSRVREFRVS